LKFKVETEFQETDIGKIPKEWRVVKLKDVATINEAGVDVTRLKGKVARIPMELIPDRGIYAKYILTPVSEVKSYVVVRAGDILLAKITPSFENGKQGIVPDDVPGGIAFATTEVYPITPVKINRLYLYYILKCHKYRKLLESKMTGTTGRRRVPRDALENLSIPIPPLEEQLGIAEVLSAVDRAIENVDESVARLERLKKALMRGLLTGRVRVNEENGKLVFHRETEFQETKIGKISKDWKVVKLEELAVEMYYGLTAKAVDQPTGLRMLRTTDIKDYKVDWNSLPYCEITDTRSYNLQKYLLRKNDLIVSRAGTAGLSVLVERDFENVIFGSYLIKVRLSETQAYPKYVHYFMQSELYWDQVLPKQAGSTLKNISLPILRNIIVPLPPINEQKEIAKIISLVDRVIELQHEERARLDHLKRGLMDLLLTGRVRVLE